VFPPKLGGEKGIALFSEYLAARTPFVAIGTKDNDLTSVKNFTLLNILSNSRLRYGNVFLYFKIRNILKSQSATHILIEHPYYGWLAWLVRKTLPVKWVVHSHNMEYLRSKSMGRWWWKALLWYETWVYRKADINFFISDDDLVHAVDILKIDPHKSHSITYGIEISTIPGDIEAATKAIRRKHNISEEEKILLFNGTLSQKANYDALMVILNIINPLLLEKKSRYKIIICGKGLSTTLNDLKEYSHKNIVYAGFVDDIDIYFKSADIFLNPITSGGGVKTKAVEAIAMNCTLISTEFGAIGLKKNVCGSKLQIVADNDWHGFVEAIDEQLRVVSNTPDDFYEYYYWGNIATKVTSILTQK
jgi:glycosyltransferase involved in cell wall biosynthesis